MKMAARITPLLLLVLSACNVGPKYRTPATPAPPAFKEPLPESFAESKEWKTASLVEVWDEGRWWELYQDPGLNAIEAQVDEANQTLKSAEAHFRQARALVRENRSVRFPTVTAGAQITREHISANRPFPAARGANGASDFVLPVDATYEADVWGRVRNLVASSIADAQATAADVASVRLSLHAELALDYFDLRSLDNEKRILEDSVRAYERALELTRNRFQGGVANSAEVAEAETQLEATQAQAIDVTDLRAHDEHAIAVLTGQTPEALSLTEAVSRFAVPAVPAGVPSALLERRPDIVAAERRVAAANSRIGFARAAFYPQVMLGATLGLEGNKITNWFNWPSRLWAIGPSAVQAIFDAGRRRAALEASTADYDALVADYRQSVLSAFQQVEDSLSSLRILENEAGRQSTAIDAARRSEQLSLNRYKGGLVTYLEVVTAQTIRLQNERAGIDIARRRMESSVLLIKALGGGWNAKSIPQPFQLLSTR